MTTTEACNIANTFNNCVTFIVEKIIEKFKYCYKRYYDYLSKNVKTLYLSILPWKMKLLKWDRLWMKKNDLIDTVFVIKLWKKKIKIKVKSPTIYWSILKTFKIGSVRKKDLNLYY